MTAVRIEGDIPLTGRLDDPRWKLAQVVEAPFEIQPGENTRARQRTFIRILYNQETLYFGFDCRDSHPEQIRAHVTDRDNIFDDDYALAIFDTYGDKQRAYELFVNPNGVQGDILRTGENEDSNFDMVWKSAAARSDSGYTVVMAIPFKSIRFPSRREQRWVMMLGRNYPRESRAIFSWTPNDRNNPCLVCQGGILTGIRDVEGTGSVELLPYAAAVQSGSLNDAGDPHSGYQNGNVQGRVGGGIRYAPTPDFAADAVVNPDFSQVESDADQVSVNTTFSLFYPEKRPFFLIGTDILQDRTNIFYSRTIDNPIGAAKITGKEGSLSYEYLAASDRNSPYIIPGEEGSDFVPSSTESFSNIARARYDLGRTSFLGTMLTSRNSSSAHNYVAGVDWNYLFWENYYFRGEAFYSDTKELNDTSLFSNTRLFGSTGHTAAFDGESYNGFAIQSDLFQSTRDYYVSLTYRTVSPTFQAQDGFVTASDNKYYLSYDYYTIYPIDSFIDVAQINANSGLHYNYDAVRKERWFVPGFSLQMKSQTTVNFQYLLVNEELFHGVEFLRINRSQTTFSSKPLGALSLSGELDLGRFIRRTDTPDLGTGHNFSLAATIRPTAESELDLSYVRSRLSSVETGELFYDGNIYRVAGIYQFSREIFLRLITQYDTFDGSFNFYPLLSYKLDPFTIFYAGFTDDGINFGGADGFTTTTRQFFVKLQYLLQS